MAEKQAVLYLGSPRKKSNSSIIGRRIADGFREGGGRVSEIEVAGMDIRPCTACEYCKTGGERYCKIEDDMEDLYPVLLDSDVIICATPIYWFHITAQLKAAVDRWYALDGRKGSDVQNLLQGKQLVLAFSYGDEDPVASGAVNAYRSFQDACAYIGMIIEETIYCRAEEAGSAAQQEDVLARAFDLGKGLV